MELRHLRYFVAVGEEQHYGRAAQRLHVAQPALSRQIQDLEKEMGFALFDRLPRGVRLNAAGKLFLTDARRILQDVGETKLRAWVNPAFYDRMMQACARGGLSAPRIVQEAPDRDTNLGLVQCRIGLSWQPETVRWHCPRGIVLLPVVDMDVRLPFNLIWKKGNSSPLLQRFVAQVEALGRKKSARAGAIKK